MSGTTDGSVAKQGAAQVRRLGSSARRQLFSMVDERKAGLLDRADGWLEKVAGAGEAVLPEGVVPRVREISSSLREKSAEELIDDLQWQARMRPGMFVLGAIALGFIAGRVLKDVGVES